MDHLPPVYRERVEAVPLLGVARTLPLSSGCKSSMVHVPESAVLHWHWRDSNQSICFG